jgi:hypothetical protein
MGNTVLEPSTETVPRNRSAANAVVVINVRANVSKVPVLKTLFVLDALIAFSSLIILFFEWFIL